MTGTVPYMPVTQFLLDFGDVIAIQIAGRGLMENRARGFHATATLERRLARQHLVQQDSEREDIAAMIDEVTAAAGSRSFAIPKSIILA